MIIYLGESVPVLGVGYGAGWVGLYPAVVTFAVLIGGLGALAALLAARGGNEGASRGTTW